MKSYFAYGANMDPVHMAAQCPGAVRVGRAILGEHRFAIATRGFGTVLPDPGSVVHGVLWRLTPADRAALDAFENEAGEGAYLTRMVELAESPAEREAMIYYAADPAPGIPSPGYLERIREVAALLAFPAGYLDQLRRAGTA